MQCKSMAGVQSSQFLQRLMWCKYICLNNENEWKDMPFHLMHKTLLFLCAAGFSFLFVLTKAPSQFLRKTFHFYSIYRITNNFFFFAKDWVFRSISLSCCSRQLHAMLKAADKSQQSLLLKPLNFWHFLRVKFSLFAYSIICFVWHWQLWCCLCINHSCEPFISEMLYHIPSFCIIYQLSVLATFRVF